MIDTFIDICSAFAFNPGRYGLWPGNACNGGDQFRGGNGFGNMNLITGHEGTGAIFRPGERGERDGRDSCFRRTADGAHPPKEFVAVNFWHTDVAEEDIGPINYFQRFGGRRCGGDFSFATGKNALYQVACIGFIVDDQDFQAGKIGLVRGAFGLARGGVDGVPSSV